MTIHYHAVGTDTTIYVCTGSTSTRSSLSEPARVWRRSSERQQLFSGKLPQSLTQGCQEKSSHRSPNRGGHRKEEEEVVQDRFRTEVRTRFRTAERFRTDEGVYDRWFRLDDGEMIAVTGSGL